MKKRTNFLIYPLLLIGVFLVFANSCEKDDDDKNVPVLSTTEVTEITANTAKSGGNITDDGGTTVTARGVCWSTSQNPTINDSKTEDGIGAESFTSNISGLEPNTTYYVRAYATNSAGTGFGSAISFTTQEDVIGSSFTDPRDGKVYQTIIIGNQEWMAENLAYVSGNYWAYNNNNENVATYGYLYDWQTALNVCPDGWHLPSDDKWTKLTDYLGGEDVAGGKLKATGTIEAGTGLWHDPNTGATNETGFTALPGGGRKPVGFGGSLSESFYGVGDYGNWWSATEYDEYDAISAWYRGMSYVNSYVHRGATYKEIGLSVRCVRD